MKYKSLKNLLNQQTVLNSSFFVCRLNSHKKEEILNKKKKFCLKCIIFIKKILFLMIKIKFKIKKKLKTSSHHNYFHCYNFYRVLNNTESASTETSIIIIFFYFSLAYSELQTLNCI